MKRSMASISKLLSPLFEALSPRQKEVVIARFGLEKQGGEETLAAIGKRMDITRERVRQIEKSALITLKKAVQ